MKVMKIIGVILIVLFAGCAGASSYRMETFQEEERAYRLALRDSDFDAAAEFIDPVAKSDDDYEPYKMIKVAHYKTKKTILSQDQLEIRQEVEIQYYHQNRPVLKTIMDKQVWTYHHGRKIWLLKSGLPDFK